MKNSFKNIHLNKVGKVSDKWESYLNYYDEIFSKFKDNEISIFEIGIQNGGSLETYAQYFSKSKLILGCDINEKCKLLAFEDPRINVIVGDANSLVAKKQVKMLAKDGLDIIIDDGSHKSIDIINSFINYFEFLKPNGIYVIEDTHCLYSRNFGGGLFNKYSATEFFKMMVDIVNYQWWRSEVEMDVFLSTFFPSKLPSFISQGWIESIEFKNSIITIRKSSIPSHDKLGRRITTGTQKIVVDLPQTLKDNNLHF
jgi:hypothetical protein